MITARHAPRKVQVLKLSFLISVAAVSVASASFSQTLSVEVGQTRSADEAIARAGQAVQTMNRNLTILTERERSMLARAGRYFPGKPVLLPATVWLTAQGSRLPVSMNGRTRGTGLNLVFDANGPNAFTPADQSFLQLIYTKAQPFLDAWFGTPAVGGNVAVKNYEIPMGDREFVTGGYYVPNAPGMPEIRTPTYTNFTREVLAVNFIHCLLLAYMGPTPYAYDAFKEGLVRAVVLQACRSNALMVTGLGLDTTSIEQVLANSYDVEGSYDWYNQRALGGSSFIAPNLRDVPLPLAGSTGGLYLMRYRMAGSAWTKAWIDHPNFIKSYNAAFYTQPGIAANVPALVSLAQTVINADGSGLTTVEGLSFAEWFKRQYILETADTRGPKLLVEPVPITSGLSGPDFGVFFIQAHWFETGANGNETLLSGTSFPIMWEGTAVFNRFFDVPESERMDIAGGYGVVAPNMQNINGGQPYRAAVDVPVQDQNQRVYLPAGAIATASQQNPRDFYGTVTGANQQTGDTLRLAVTVNGTPITDVPVTNNAFGVLIGTAPYLGTAKITVDVIRTHLGLDTTLLSRKINKGPGSLALDLRVDGEAQYSFPDGLPKGISLVGFPVDPLQSLNSSVLGISDSQTLAARFNSSRARYDLYPDLESFKVGHGYFIRTEVAVPGFSVVGRVNQNVEATVALKPGWNMVCTPFNDVVTTDRIRVVKAAELPSIWADSVGVDIGSDFFEFTPGSNDAASGAPETGTLSPAAQFEPGKAYFVRVLAPEGVSLVFAQASMVGLSPSRMQTSAATTGWQTEVKLTGLNNRKAKAVIGQSTTASRAFDPKEDSGMPPSFGSGLQVIVEDYEPLFRDIRAIRFESYTLHFQGLTPNKVHKIDLRTLKGSPPTLTLRDSKGKSLGTLRPGFVFSFVPKNRNEYYRLEGGR